MSIRYLVHLKGLQTTNKQLIEVYPKDSKSDSKIKTKTKISPRDMTKYGILCGEAKTPDSYPRFSQNSIMISVILSADK
jgi:hypothetical protein